jgi:hypothetical protein
MSVEKCYLCGSETQLTRDHVPPQSFFPPPLPKNLITLQCCEKCHKPFSLEDEAFRVWVASVNGRSSAGKWIWKNRVIGSSFKRSPKLREHVSREARILNLNLPSGPVPVPTLAIPIDRANLFLRRITKGLIAHFYPDYDFRNDEFKIFCIAPIPRHAETIKNLIRFCRYDFRGDGVFEFWHSITAERNGGCWIYRFYEAAWFVVIHDGRGSLDSPD